MTAKEAEVRKRLSVVVVLVELASLVLLFFLLRIRVVQDTLGIKLLLLLPIIFGLHVTEEFIVPGGFIAWDNLYRPQFRDTPGSFYVNVNRLPLIAAVLVVLGAFNYEGKYAATGLPSWLGFLTFMAWNAIFHLRGAIATKQYSPGMLTGLLLFVPCTVASYAHFIRVGAVHWYIAAVCVAAALAVQPMLDWFKRRKREDGD